MASHLADEELSIGNFVLSGGELAAAVVIDVWQGCCPACSETKLRRIWESFSEGHGPGLLDCPQWTRPAEFRGIAVPDVLLSGNHEEIRKMAKEGGGGKDGAYASRPPEAERNEHAGG